MTQRNGLPTAKATDCQSNVSGTIHRCEGKATKHIVEPNSLRVRHFCAPHATRYLQQLATTGWASNFNAKLDATAATK